MGDLRVFLDRIENNNGWKNHELSFFCNVCFAYSSGFPQAFWSIGEISLQVGAPGPGSILMLVNK
jgi:hypothetical protein